jgi:hypothetical protein
MPAQPERGPGNGIHANGPSSASRCHRRHACHTPFHSPTQEHLLTDLRADIKSLTISSPSLITELGPAFQKYNEEQFATVKLPGSSQPVIISSHSSLGGNQYYDIESSTSFTFDHTTQKASAVESYVSEGAQSDLA